MRDGKALPAAVTSFYVNLLGPIRARAVELGYEIAVHGSLRNDMDLVAIPWEENAVAAEELADAIRVVSGGFIPNTMSSPAEVLDTKGCTYHGGRQWLIHFGGPAAVPAFIDLIVMPRRCDWEARR